MTDGLAYQYLVSAALSSMKEAGLVTHPEAGDKMGAGLKERLEAGESREQLVAAVRRWVKLAGTDHEGLGWLARYPESRAA